VEALAHEQDDALVAAEHVDQLELDRAVGVALADAGDVVHRRRLAEALAGEGRAARDVDEQVVGQEAEGGVPVAALGRGEVIGHELAWGHVTSDARGRRRFRRVLQSGA
jgi:hypothetical protein